MRHPSHGATIRPAERDRGCVWKDDFRSTAAMGLSGWTLFNTPTFDARGMGLNGTTQHGGIPLQREFSSASLTLHAEFYPTFEADDGVGHDLLDAVPSLNYRITKTSADALSVYLGSTNVLSFALGAYQTYWIAGGRNVISVSGVSGANSLRLNGVNIGTGAAAWTPSTVTDLDIGRRSNGTQYFPGSVSRLYIGHHTSDLAEHAAVYNNTMWSYQNRAVVDLQFRTADYDIGNVRTLDSSGNGNHATLGDGSTPTTYPTQGAGRMAFDGGDYLDLDGIFSLHTQTEGTFLIAFGGLAPAGGEYLIGGRDGVTDTRVYITTTAAGALNTNWGATAQGFAGANIRDGNHTVAVTWFGGDFYIYLDGAYLGTNSYTTGAGSGAKQLKVGSDTNGATNLSCGTVFDKKLVYEALNQTQILDYHSNVMRRMGAEA